MSNCIVCDDKMSARATVKCEYCDFVACRACCRRYIINESIPKCMGENCGREWTREHMVNTLKKSWISKEYKEHRENILYDKERALLPATQEVANARKEHAKLKEDLYSIDAKIRRLKSQRFQIERNMRIVYARSRNMQAADREERRAFVKKCPADNCLGYLSSQWKCGTCNVWACPDCHVVKGLERDTEHTCDPDTLATARLLAQDTKACPNCHIDIYKIDGCNQMWCVKCHTAFDWNTLRIERGVVHNPHYFQYMRDTNNGVVPRNPLDNQCGGGANQLNARRLIVVGFLMRDTNDISMKVTRMTRNIIHLTQVEMPAMRIDYANRNLELRISYLNREYSEKEFKIQLQRSEKRFEKKRAMFQIYEMASNTIGDILMGFIEKCTQARNKHPNINTPSDIFKPDTELLIKEWQEVLIPQIEGIATYSNECLVKIADTFSSKPVRFDEDFGFVIRR